MIRQGCQPDFILLKRIYGLRVKREKAIFEDIRSYGFLPDIRSYFIPLLMVSQKLVRLGKHPILFLRDESARAYEILKEMKLKRISPKVAIYGSIIDGLVMIDMDGKIDERRIKYLKKLISGHVESM